MKIYGYRSKKAWKMGLATFIYGLILMMITIIAIINPSSSEPIITALIAFACILVWLTYGVLWIVAIIKKNGKAKRNILISGICFVMFFVVLFASPSDSIEEIEARTTAVKAKLKESQEKLAAIEAKQTEDQKSFVLAFEKEIYAQDELLQKIFQFAITSMDSLSKGKIDINGAYEATKKAHDAAILARTYTSKIEIEKSLPIDVRELLEGARNELAIAYYEKANALQAAMDYLDDQKPSYLQDFKDYKRSSDAFMISSMAKILDAKIKVGIK